MNKLNEKAEKSRFGKNSHGDKVLFNLSPIDIPKPLARQAATWRLHGRTAWHSPWPHGLEPLSTLA